MNTRKYCHHKGDVPKEPHFAVVEFTQYYVEGDERSRTNPGHGYPGGYENKALYISFTDEAEWKAYVAHRQLNDEGKFIAIKVVPAIISTNVSVSIS